MPSRMFSILKNEKKISITVPHGEKLVAFEKAASNICVTGSGFTRHLIIKYLGTGCFMFKQSSTHHRLLLQRCLGLPFILPVAVMLRYCGGAGGVKEILSGPACHFLLHQLSQHRVFSTWFLEHRIPKDSEFWKHRTYLKALFGLLL